MTMTIMTMMMMGVVDEPTYLYLSYLSVPRQRRRLLPNQLNGISVAIWDELEFLVISWKGGNGMDMYKSIRRRRRRRRRRRNTWIMVLLPF